MVVQQVVQQRSARRRVRHRRSRRHLVPVALLLTGTFVAGCSDETSGDTSSSTSSSTSGDALPDRERERTQIRQSLGAVLDACGDRDRDRLRLEVHDRLRNLVDAAMFRFREQARFELMEMTVVFDNGQATVEARVRVREANRRAAEEQHRWRFERDVDGWRLIDLPPCLEGAGPAPSNNTSGNTSSNTGDG